MKQPTTTLNEIRAHKPCSKGWKQLLSHLNKTEADDEPLPFLTILESNGFKDTIWAMSVQPHNPLWRHFSVDCAERVKHLMQDPRSLNALDVARKHALGEASDEELHAAHYAARDAAEAAAWGTVWYSAWGAAWYATRDAVIYAAWGAAKSSDGASAAYAAKVSAKDVAWAATKCAAGDEERAWQTARLKDLLTWGEWRPVEQTEEL